MSKEERDRMLHAFQKNKHMELISRELDALGRFIDSLPDWVVIRESVFGSVQDIQHDLRNHKKRFSELVPALRAALRQDSDDTRQASSLIDSSDTRQASSLIDSSDTNIVVETDNEPAQIPITCRAHHPMLFDVICRQVPGHHGKHHGILTRVLGRTRKNTPVAWPNIEPRCSETTEICTIGDGKQIFIVQCERPEGHGGDHIVKNPREGYTSWPNFGSTGPKDAA